MRMTLLATVVVGLLASQAQAQGKAKAQPAPAAAPTAQLQTEEEKTLYALGHGFGKGLAVFGLSPAELEIIKRGLTDSVTGAPSAVDVDLYSGKLQGLAKSRQAKANDAFLAKAAEEKGAVKLPSGVIYKEVQAGTGANPKAKDTVAVHYRGTLMTGEEFDSSYRRNQVAEFPLNGVIPCWTEGVQKMKVGGKARLVCPAKAAYGDRPPMGSKIPPNAVLEFEIELVGIPGDTSRQ
ncbi:FKBP-type peptidyl-prolyl cis-trans isomerase [Hyalangium rubrum]|uniref:Peptidyl-prolyl cis-trans isomerase n=1 Tax=Hyalangium rubrum TaxID=3103134 RepID=A0ABU5HFG6_9BACT|nr:FKBP-type peptidyl-prolyl cis-trans isomerase [Hyalangium sp. s54d21]MDY7231553.1 FKBP-type peptidyl-prolyl cis-trans isomerase [Hyalangium sp. s54d21]